MLLEWLQLILLVGLGVLILTGKGCKCTCVSQIEEDFEEDLDDFEDEEDKPKRGKK